MVKTRSSARLSSTSTSQNESGAGSNQGFYDNLPPDKVEKTYNKKKLKTSKPKKTNVTLPSLNIPVRNTSAANPVLSKLIGTTTVTPVASVAPLPVSNYPVVTASSSTTSSNVVQPSVILTPHPYTQIMSNHPQQPAINNQIPVYNPQVPQSRTVQQWLLNQSNRSDMRVDSVPLSRMTDLEQHIPSSYMKVGNNRYPVHPDVKFKRLPFYQEIAELMKPSTLVPKMETGVQENTFYFHLTPQQAQMILNAPEANVMLAQLRFCKVETSCEQDDCFPPSIGVKINNRVCPLPMPIPTNKCYVEPKRPPGPVNITSLMKLSPTVANQIVVTWMNDFMTGYAITVTFVKKLNPSALLNRLKNKGTKNPDYTRSLIKEKLREDLDSEIATTSLRVSLVCPLGKMRMQCPCRPVTCIHLQCFDASIFLAMNEKKPSWVCPVCDKAALYDNLVVDGYFLEVLNSSRLAPDCTEIQLHKDGSWSCHIKTDIVPQQVFSDVEVIADDDVIPLSDGSDSSSGLPSIKRGAGSREDFPDQPSPRPPPSVASNASSSVVVGSATVDLTSDSDDDLPLRRKIPKKQQQQVQEEISSSSKDSDSENNVVKKKQRHSSLDLAVSSIISLDSPSPLTVPTSPNGNSSEAPVIIESMDLDAETTEALKQISTNDQPIDLETPERIASPNTPFETSHNSPDPDKAKDNNVNDEQEDPIGVNSLEESKTEEGHGEEIEDSPAKSVRSGVITPERMPIEALEKLIDIANTSETNEPEMPDPLEIEEAVCSVTATSDTFDDTSNHRIDFVKDPIGDVLGKDNQFFTSVESSTKDPTAEESTENQSANPSEESAVDEGDKSLEKQTEATSEENSKEQVGEISEKNEGEDKETKTDKEEKAESKKDLDDNEDCDSETEDEDSKTDKEEKAESKKDDNTEDCDSESEDEDSEEDEEDQDDDEDSEYKADDSDKETESEGDAEEEEEPETIVDT